MDIDTSHALIDLQEMKDYLKESKDTDDFDSILGLFINSASLYLESECGGRIFIEATYGTTYLDGTGERILVIPHYPITSIATVEEDDVALTEGRENDYVIYGDEGEGYLEKMGSWAKGNKNITLTDLKAGYLLAAIPADLKEICMIMVNKAWEKEQNKAGAEEMRSFPDMSITWNFGQDEYVKKIIRKYKRMGV